MRILSFVFILNLCLNNFIYPMEHSQYVSSSTTPSSPESLTLEQRQKIADELSDQESKNLEQSQEEIKLESAWFCDKKFSVQKVDKFKKIKSFLKIKSKLSYSKLDYCGSNLFIIEEDGYVDRNLKIFDTDSGKCLHELNLVKGERVRLSIGNRYCKLPDNKIAYLICDCYAAKKIKIVDLNSCKILDNFIDCESLCKDFIVNQILYLPNYRLVLVGSKNSMIYFSNHLMIIDLNNGMLLREINNDNIFNRDDVPEYLKGLIRSVRIFNEQLWLRFYEHFFIMDPDTGKIKAQEEILIPNYLDQGRFVAPMLDNTILYYNKFIKCPRVVFLKNEKYNFQKIKQSLNEASIIPDLQNIILEYLSDKWLIDREMSVKDAMRWSKVRVLSKNKLLMYYFTDKESISILNLDNAKQDEISLEKKYKKIIAMQDGRIAILFADGSIEIWKER